MDKPKSKMHNKVLVLAVVAISYILISNFDTLDFPEHLWNNLRGISLIVSFVGGFLFFTSFIPLTLAVVRLIRRERLGRLVVWPLFIGILFVVDLAFTRRVFVNFSQERIIRRAEPLIAAIEQYRLDSGSYPTDVESLVPEYIEQLPKPNSRKWSNFMYENLDSTYQVRFNLWVSGRTYRSIVYTPTKMYVDPEYALSDAHDTGIENWDYYYY